jgi:two-component system OmpR family sensor kinase
MNGPSKLVNALSLVRRSFFLRLSLVLLLLLALVVTVGFAAWYHLWTRYSDYAEELVSWGLASAYEQDLRPALTPSPDPHQIHNVLTRLGLRNPRAEVYVLDSGGHILASVADLRHEVVDPAPLEQFLRLDSLPDEPLYGDDPARKRVYRRSAVFSVARTMVGGQPGYVYVTLRGGSYDLAHKVLGEADARRLSRVWGAIAFAFVGTVGVMLFWLATVRLRRLKAFVARFASGDYRVRAPVLGSDEIGELASALNRMASTIESQVEALREKDDLRRELVANVSHDLRSPLLAIDGYLDILRSSNLDRLDSEGRTAVEVLSRKVPVLRRLSDDLFQLSKLEAAEATIQTERFSLAEVSENVLSLFRRRSAEQGVSLELDAPEELPAVYGDPLLIERALHNLVDNALRYTPSQGTVRIHLAEESEHVAVSVEDTGRGINEAHLPLLFERFYRIEETAAERRTGTGLGLAIVKRIVEAHGGSISVRSAPGVGTAFSFRLPWRDYSGGAGGVHGQQSAGANVSAS